MTAKPLGEKKGDKVKIFKYRPKSGYARRAGHRQLLTLLEIEDVRMGGAKKASPRAAKAEKPTRAAPRGARRRSPAAGRRRPAEVAASH